jgi:hypothetical protein
MGLSYARGKPYRYSAISKFAWSGERRLRFLPSTIGNNRPIADHGFVPKLLVVAKSHATFPSGNMFCSWCDTNGIGS